MSVYNEKLQWLRESVESMLQQSFTDFEYIIVVDNPQLPIECRDYLDDIAVRDKRVRLVYNLENMGLPYSLNKGASLASGIYIARMDADDISLPKRLEMELNFLKKNDADLVSCNFIKMDEDGNLIADSSAKNLLSNVDEVLPIINLVVHPGVLMKAEIFRNLGGYRNFKTAQDYDLWLRFLSDGYHIRLMNDVLLHYRIRNKSITSQKMIEQFYAAKYEQRLYRMRLRTGTDDYTEENYAKYLKSKNIEHKATEKLIKADREISLGKKKIKSQPFVALKHFVAAFTLFPEYFLTKSLCKVKLYGKRALREIDFKPNI